MTNRKNKQILTYEKTTKITIKQQIDSKNKQILTYEKTTKITLKQQIAKINCSSYFLF